MWCRLRQCHTWCLLAGIISVIGISFTFINVTIQSMSNMMVSQAESQQSFSPLWVTCWHSVCACPLVTSRRTWCLQKAGDTWSEAYSRILGTLLVCAWLTVALSFMPPKLLRRIFPPLVTGWVLDPTAS